jgi:hypothetical protein
MDEREKPKYSFHQQGGDFRMAVNYFYKGALAYMGLPIEDEDNFSRFNKIDTIFIKKYGCVRCPHRGTDYCPYGIGDERTVKRTHVLTPWEKVVKEMPESDEKVIIASEHREGICKERIREMGWFTKQVTSMNGLLSERADNMRDMRDLKEKMQNIVRSIEKEPATFKTSEGDEKVKTVLAQYQDTLNKYNQFLDNAINQQLKYEEIKQRDREGPKTIDVAAVEAHIKKTLSQKPLEEKKSE